jgi:hypothetical protein
MQKRALGQRYRRDNGAICWQVSRQHGQAVLTSLLVTLEQRGYDALEWFSAARCARIPLPLPP